jgi:endonuclease/exonuclease/phosphatase family metal-dependent hydrolase
MPSISMNPVQPATRLRALAISLLALTACAHLPAGSPGVPMRVMTYNIRSGNGDLARTAETIRAESPDLVALQEVDVHWADRSGFADQATELGERLKMNVRFARIYHIPNADSTRPAREFGVALLSRYPVTAFSDDTLTRLSTQDANPVPTPMPGLLNVTVDVNGTPVRVFNTHLDYRADPRVRQIQVREMLARIGDTSTPVIVFGDMNAKPSAPELQPLLTRFHDAWSTANGNTPGFTYPADAPNERIDYVLVSDAFRVRSARVPATEASDHRPVVVDLTLEGAR